jgi:hypothetical protein
LSASGTASATPPSTHCPRRNKLSNASDDDTDINRAGGWSYERLIVMDQRFRAAMERALTQLAAYPPRPR